MCGIFGYVRRSSCDEPMRDEVIATGLEAIQARGPDGQGCLKMEFDGYTLDLVHTRLAIIDLSEHGYQPMEDRASGWSIIFNGEIYNHVELREQLKSFGERFQSTSDTEVLLKAWVQWGLDALPRLNGMFAFAVFNRRTRELWLVRDRFGVKPLLWARLPGEGLVFSSSVAAVARLANAEVDLDYCARGVHYLAFESPESGAPFQSVQAVPGGGWLKVRVSGSGLTVTDGQWYHLEQAVSERVAGLHGSSDAQLLEECRYLLQDSVRLRLRSDVPVAVSLSGGLDSTCIATLASREVSGLKGFSYGSPAASRSEGTVVASFARKMGIEAEFIWPQYNAAGLEGLLERVLAFQESPFSGLTVLAQNEVFRAVRQAGFKVLLGGQGGDEVFAGYRKFFVVALRDALRRREVGSAFRLIYSVGLMLWHEAGQAKMYWRGLSRYNNRFPFDFKLLNWRPPVINLWGDKDGSLASRQVEDVLRWSLPTLLRYEDRNSTGYGLETRLPFMDFRLVELGLALPVRLKIAGGYGKWALRSITKGAVPDDIRLARRKRGFDVTQSWIRDGIGASLRSHVRDHRSELACYLRPQVDIEHDMSDERLCDDANLLREVLMLAWLAQPVRLPQIVKQAA